MTHIYIPSGRFVDGQLPAIRIGLEGWITLRARSRFGTIRREHSFRAGGAMRRRGPFHNLITDLGLNRAGAGGVALYTHFHVGTGTTPPNIADTQLGNFSGSLISQGQGQGGNSGEPDFYAWRRVTYLNAIGALGNVILTECGVSGQGTNGNLWSRELIRDSNGDPSTFPISSDEQLEAIYELRLYAPTGDVSQNENIGANSFDTITRAINVNSASNGWALPTGNASSTNMFGSGVASQQALYTGDLVPITTSFNSGIISSATSVATESYDQNSFERTIEATWGSGISGDVRTVRRAFGCCAFQVRLDPVFEKNANQSLRLWQKVEWGRR